MRYKEVVRSFLESQSNKEYDTNPHSQLHILSQPEVIPNNSGGKENWYIKFITHYMSNLNIPGVIDLCVRFVTKDTVSEPATSNLSITFP